MYNLQDQAMKMNEIASQMFLRCIQDSTLKENTD